MSKVITSIIFITLAFLLGYFILFSENLYSTNDLKVSESQGYESVFTNSESYKNQLDTLTVNYNDLTKSFNSESAGNQKLIAENTEHKNTITQLEEQLKETAKLEENADYVSAREELDQTNEEYKALSELFGNCCLVVEGDFSKVYILGSTYTVGTSGKSYLITTYTGDTTQVDGGYILDLLEHKYTITEVENE